MRALFVQGYLNDLAVVGKLKSYYPPPRMKGLPNAKGRTMKVETCFINARKKDTGNV